MVGPRTGIRTEVSTGPYDLSQRTQTEQDKGRHAQQGAVSQKIFSLLKDYELGLWPFFSHEVAVGLAYKIKREQH